MERENSGFSLVEVLVAVALAATVVAGVGSLATISRRATEDARARTVASHAAIQKVEQLRAQCLAGVGVSRGGSTEASADGFWDRLDRDGAPTTESVGAFTRRWSVEAGPRDLCVFRAAVATVVSPNAPLRLATLGCQGCP